MGSGRFSADTWTTYSTVTRDYASKSRDEIFTSRSLDSDLDPKDVFRESRDSEDNPNSTPIIIAQDVTGSMGSISEVMARKGVPTLLTELYEQRPVADPHVMCMAIGDVECDDSPLQVTQFEADIRIAQQLEKFYLEGGGGANGYESYALAWWFAKYRTLCDSKMKRGKKGYLFTIGDEPPTGRLTGDNVQRFLGGEVPSGDIDLEKLINDTAEDWEVFHVMVEEGNHYRYYPDSTRDAWTNVLGQRAIGLKDHTKLAETIVAAIGVCEGLSVTDITAKWDGDTSLVVSDAVKGLSKVSSSGGVVTL